MPSKQLHVLLEPALPGATHMRRDRALLDAWRPGDPPVLRLYSWKPPAISLGWMQRAEKVLDLEKCRRRGIDVVQRPTGGRAVLHHQEVTYALVASTDAEPFAGGLHATHRAVAACLSDGLQRLGVDAELSRPNLDRRHSLPCFASAGRAELLVGGRKLVGSAQRRLRHAFLQHGSLLVGPAHLQLVDYLRDTTTDAVQRRQLQRRLRQGTTCLVELLDCDPGFEVVAAALVRGFAARLGRTAIVEQEVCGRTVDATGT